MTKLKNTKSARSQTLNSEVKNTKGTISHIQNNEVSRKIRETTKKR